MIAMHVTFSAPDYRDPSPGVSPPTKYLERFRRFACKTPSLMSLMLLIGMSVSAFSAPIGLMERFALSADREAVLAELIPGSHDYFFYHCLHFQNTGQLERSDAILKDWIASRKGSMTALMHSMMDRQRLLTYDQSPKQSIDYFVKRLGLQLHHSPPVKKGVRRYPTEFSQELIDLDRLVSQSLRDNVRLTPAGMQIAASRFRRGDDQAVPIALRDFLKRVSGPYLFGLDALVIKELKSRPARDVRFGDIAAHQFLTLPELDAVGRAVPAVAVDNGFVTAKLKSLRPSGEVDLSQQPEMRRQYLARVEEYVRGLPAAFNSMKASASYRLLEANLAAGIWDRNLFLRYLQLPRQSPLISPALGRLGNRANLNQDFTAAAILPPIRNENQLVETYLEYFLRDAQDTREFEALVQRDFLRRVFARTKLMAGAANPQPFYDMLSAGERQQLRDKIQLSFAPNNPQRYAKDQATELLVDVKNIDKLVVRVYEMNSLAYYRSNEKPLDTDIDLDGLIATHERTIQYDRPQIERHREAIAIPEISQRGVWIVDLVGKGLRARTLIRRGDLQTVRSSDANGMKITVLDEDRNPIPGALILVGNQEFTANKDGKVMLSMVNKSVNRRAILSDGKIAKPMTFRHLEENYKLSAGFYVDRTLLQTGGTADVIVRPKLMLGDTMIDPGTLADVSLSVVATDLDGITTTKQFDDLKVDQAKELSVKFRVPSRVANIQFRLTGSITGLSDRRKRDLEVSRSIEVSGIRRTTQTVDAFLTRDGENYVIETRGRTGEPVAAATVHVAVRTVIGDVQPDQNLQSDDQGRVQLGRLDNVVQLSYGIAGQNQHKINLELDEQIWPVQIHLSEKQTLRLPVVNGRKADSYRLLEVRGGVNRTDLTKSLAVQDGFLTSGELDAGDYQLVDTQSGRATQVVVVAGPAIDHVLVGKIRHRDQNLVTPVSISRVQRQDDGSLSIQLAGDTALARVHVVGSRYFDHRSPLDDLFLGLPALRGRRLSLARCGYVSDLRLGDEYEYVLRRRYAAKYPGVMLPQPSILLNPWETETTSNNSQSARDGQAPGASAAAEPNAMARGGASQRKADAESARSSDYDFLIDSGMVAANLVPDENGQLTIPADAVSGLPIVQIIVADPVTVMRRTIAGKLGEAKTDDLRLANSLPLETPYSFERAVSVVSNDQPLDLATLGSAQVQVYSDVASLLSLYRTLVKDARLDDFQILGRWHSLSSEQKLQTYSSLACHELHVFLKIHDLDFFEAVIKPYLRNKKEKQFIDHWLLDEDLSRYTEIWRYRELSAAERALLAIRVPDLRPQIRRDLRNSVDLIEENYEQLRVQVESALRAEGLYFSLADAEVEFETLAEVEMQVQNNQVRTYADFAEVPSVEKRSVVSGNRFGGARGAESLFRMQRENAAKAMMRATPQAAPSRRLLGRALAESAPAFYQELDSTKQWAESHWDQTRVVGGPNADSLIPVNAFWNDLANDEYESKGLVSPAVSKHLLKCAQNRHSALLGLALSGLPLQSGEVSLPAKPETVYQPEHAVALVTKRLKKLAPAQGGATVLIGQLFRPISGGEPLGDENAEPNRFATGTPYQGQVVVSNPTPTERVVELFWQIPAGSIPLGGSQVTDSKTVKLAPFAVSSVDYQFYFPSAGDFVHYPATIAADDTLLARGEPKRFEVLPEWSDDAITWQSIARNGDAEAIAEFLADANLHEIDWSEVLHRLRDRDVYDVVTQVVAEARLPEADIWAYGFHHQDEHAIRQLLSLRKDLIDRVGPALDSNLLSVNAIDRRTLEHLEYAPLIRARAHRLGSENEILNPTFMTQYQSFVRNIGFQPHISEEEKLPLTYYLLLQNRIEEAIGQFGSIDRNRIASQLQYDYVAGYLAMHEGKYEDALAVAQAHLQHPVPRWRGRFAEMANQIGQRFELMDSGQLVSVDGKSKAIDDVGVSPKDADLALADRERANSAASASVPEVIARVEGDNIRIDHRNADQVNVNLFGVDLELLFSKAPFARNDLQRIAMVKPTRSDTLTMKTKTGTAQFSIPRDLRSRTLLVEASVGASRSTTLYYGGELTTYVSEGFGQLQTTDAKTHRPVAGAYVKVYARYPDGGVRFFKDGYTDGRGRFDYTSVSAGEAKGAKRFAILVLSDQKGATLHDVAAP